MEPVFSKDSITSDLLRVEYTSCITRLAELILATSSLKLGLVGEIGSGKTTFVKKLLSELEPEIAPAVSSPTFNYLNIYEGRLIYAHFDFYRLKHSAQLNDISFWDIIAEAPVVLVEWVELFPDVLAEIDIVVEFYSDMVSNLNLSLKINSEDYKNYLIN